MLLNKFQNRYFYQRLFVGLTGVGVGLVSGVLVGANPQLLGVALVGVIAIVWFFAKFQQAVLGLLILRSSLDIFSAQQLPAAFAIGLDALTLVYVTVQLLLGQSIKIDKFWWVLAFWIALQGLWVILLPLGGLGLDGSYLLASVREWVRLFTWLMVYLLVMQLQDKVHPNQVVSSLFFGLIVPLTAATMQTFLPMSLLPPMLVNTATDPTGGSVSRINGTLGHPNTFATFLLLFLGLTYWKQQQAQRRLPWLFLLGAIAFFFVGTKALFSLMMLATFIFVLLVPKLNIPNLLGGVVLFAIVIGLFTSTEFGQERLASIMETPLLNPDMDISRAILLSEGDGNSFNWRLAQWTYLLGQWQHFPWLGFGLGISDSVSQNGLLPHNDYVRALIEGGIVGMAAFLTFLSSHVVRLLQLIRSAPTGSSQRSLCQTLLAVFLAIPVGMITENIWSHTTLFFYWSTLIAVAGWNWHELKTGEESASIHNFSNFS
ncbi:polymerase [Scytonema sp. UIC 10036]|uniref:O-antigen ligase family protein n=1 Tax=Scytonema sp. UIC 10036 TaxID=2304196 RepID=UPI0012DAA162|nr:O-antigen ligase family protein [Scytonema sp. UIC 10036]MUG99148.1 polymerase [Scytonema sp. UIC 10036]